MKTLLLFFFLSFVKTEAQEVNVLSSEKYVILPSLLELRVDFNTEKKIPYLFGEMWVIDTIKETESYGYKRLSVFLRNSRKNKYVIDLSDFKIEQENGKIITSGLFNKYLQKFGKSNLKDILQETVSIGMTTAMVKASWGEPDNINRTITAYGTHEQWIYPQHYLYFDSNKLTAIQDER